MAWWEWFDFLVAQDLAVLLEYFLRIQRGKPMH
jgi:hypothetical protein